MRKGSLVAFLGAGLSIALAFQVAVAAAPYVSAPSSVEKGKTFEIVVENCMSGSDYGAVIEEEYTSPKGAKGTRFHETDPSGRTVLRFIMEGVGRYTLVFYCRHLGKGTWWGPETITIESTEPASVYGTVEVRPTKTTPGGPDIKINTEIDPYPPLDGLPIARAHLRSGAATVRYLDYEVSGPKPLGKKEGRVTVEADGLTTIKLKNGKTARAGKYQVNVSAVDVHDSGVEEVVWQGIDGFKLVD